MSHSDQCRDEEWRTGPHFFHVRGSTRVWEGKGLVKADFEGYLPYTIYHLNFRAFFFFLTMNV